MRILNNYRANPLNTNEPLVLVALDGVDVYGCNHSYAVFPRASIPPKAWATGVLPPLQYRRILREASAKITIQPDAPKTSIDPNMANSGMTDSMLLGIVLERLQKRQANTALACDPQAEAITSVQAALASLQQRSV